MNGDPFSKAHGDPRVAIIIVTLFTLVVVLLLSLTIGSDQQAGQTDKRQQQPNSSEPAQPAALGVIETQSHPDDKTSRAKEPLVSDTTLLVGIPVGPWSEWAQALVGAVACVLALWTISLLSQQTNATKIAADAAKASTDAIKNLNRQWIDNSEWSVKALMGTEVSMLTVSFVLTNNSNLPVFLNDVRSFIDLDPSRVCIQIPRQYLGPTGRYRVTLTGTLDSKATSMLAQGIGLTVVIAGWISFDDAFGEQQRQLFGRFNVVYGTQKSLSKPYAWELKVLVDSLQAASKAAGADDNQPVFKGPYYNEPG